MLTHRVRPDHAISIVVPSSKSIANRALVLSSLAEWLSVLKGDFEADDVFCKNTTEFIRKIAAIINPVLRLEVINEDPDDNKILACADEGKADYIVTGDNHLLNVNYRGLKPLSV